MSEQQALVTEREALAMGFNIYGGSEAMLSGLSLAHEHYGTSTAQLAAALVLRTVALKLVNKL